MKLQNGYKVIYEKIADGKRTFFADKMDGTGADQLNDTPFEIGEYKLIYQNNEDGKFYGSTSGIPAAGDHCFSEFDKVFVEGYQEESNEPAPANVEPEVTEPAPAKVEPENEEPDVGDEGDEEESEIDPEDEENGIVFED
jgi:hypothetical protein